MITANVVTTRPTKIVHGGYTLLADYVDVDEVFVVDTFGEYRNMTVSAWLRRVLLAEHAGATVIYTPTK